MNWWYSWLGVPTTETRFGSEEYAESRPRPAPGLAGERGELGVAPVWSGGGRRSSMLEGGRRSGRLGVCAGLGVGLCEGMLRSGAGAGLRVSERRSRREDLRAMGGADSTRCWTSGGVGRREEAGGPAE